MKKQVNNEGRSGLVGPDTIVLRAVAGRGPLTGAGEMLDLRPTQVRFTNTTAAPLTLTGASFDPPHLDASGAAAEGALATEAAVQTVAPGESVTLSLHGRAPARAGLYRSTLRLQSDDSVPSATPLELRVSASPKWGLGCLLFGLLLAGLVGVFDDESGVRRQRHDALQLRQEIHELLEQVPPPLVAALPVGPFLRELDQALVLLGQGRRWSFVDRRVAEARPHLAAAQKQAEKLRAATAKHTLAAADTKGLEQRWEELQTTCQALVQQFPTAVPAADTFAGRLDAFNTWAAQRVLAPTLGYAAQLFPYDLARVQLLYAAGRDTEAANLANTVRRGLQRTANLVREHAELLAFFRQAAADNVTTEKRLQRRLVAAPLAPERRATIAKSLDAATALLHPPYTFAMRRLVNLRIEESATDLFRAAQESALAAVAAARAGAEAEDSIDAIQSVVDQGATLPRGADGKILPEARFVWLQQVGAAWRARLASFPEPNPPALLSALDSFDQALAARNLDDISTRLHSLTEQWRRYSTDRAIKLINRALAPICLSLREDIFVSIEAIRENLQALGTHPRLQDWENQLEALRMQAAATPDTEEGMNNRSLAEFAEVYGSVFAFSNQVSSAQWDRVALSPSARLWLVAELGSTLAQSTMENLRSAERVLRFNVLTPAEEQYAGRALRFQIANLDPAWKHGVQLQVSFGDGATLTFNAEELARGDGFTHTYARPGLYPLLAHATPCLAPTHELGASQPQTLQIEVSPASNAARWADAFLNLRFGLALLIAGTLYFWRFQAKATTFGANSLDYAEAFSLGFAASLAVNTLPATIVRLFS